MAMYEGRDLKKEIAELGIVAIEDYGVGSLESTFVALDAIREYEELHPYKERLEEIGEVALCDTTS